MRLPLPGPSDAVELVARATASAETLASLLPRAVGLLDSADQLLGRVDALVERIEGTRQAADEVIERTDAVVTDANALIVRTAGTVGSVEPTVQRADQLLSSLAPSLEKLQPTLQTLADTTAENEVAALVDLVDHLPQLVKALDENVMPILESFDTVAPDIHELLDVTRELNEMIAKIPGMGIVRKRIDDED